jgi:hypothetical protein
MTWHLAFWLGGISQNANMAVGDPPFPTPARLATAVVASACVLLLSDALLGTVGIVPRRAPSDARAAGSALGAGAALFAGWASPAPSQTSDAPRCGPLLAGAAMAGSAAQCDHLYAAGMQASGSTLVHQLLKRIVAHRAATVVVEKTHRLPHCDGRKCSSRRCAVVSYRDFRDVVCSHARRSSGCTQCGPAAMQPSVLATLEELFSSGGRERWGERLEAYRAHGVPMVRYEDFVDCPDRLARALMRWTGVMQAPEDAGRAAELADALAAEFSLDRNRARAEQVEGGFARLDRATGVHGHHVSQGGRTGAWRDGCFTREAAEAARRSLNGLLGSFGYIGP